MKYMLDTNICIYVIRKKRQEVIARLVEHDPGDICISAITYAELMHGVEKSAAPDRNRMAAALFLSPITILDFDADAAEEYGQIRFTLDRRGTPIGPMDTLIAAHARAKRLILVTNNMKEFERVDGLELENWAI